MSRGLDPGDAEREPRPRSATPTDAAHRDRKDRAQPLVRARIQHDLSSGELQTMYDLGRFRVLVREDLLKLRYSGDARQMEKDFQRLQSQNLAERKTFWMGRNRDVASFWTLTRLGKQALQLDPSLSREQALYSGFVKPAELRHDAAIYRMYQRHQAQIAREGGRVRRVMLDYELKKSIYPALAKAKAGLPSEYAKKQAEIAQAHGLKVVNGHIVLPDLRVEYEDRQGLATSVDLEVASEDYHGSHAAEKAAAGFKIYALGDAAGRLSRALDEREITAEILSL